MAGPAGAPANVVVVLLDAARAASLPPTGQAPVARTPVLGELARSGTTFSGAIAPGNWTLPSHLSFFTGAYPWRHGLRTFSDRRAALPTIAEWLRARGYSTGLFTEEVHLVAGYGLEAGYEQTYCPIPATSDRGRTLTNRLFGGSSWLYSGPVRGLMSRVPFSAPLLTYPNYRAEVTFKDLVCNDRTVEAFGEWVAARPRDQAFHAFLNFVDPHEPYVALPGNGSSSAGRLARGYSTVPRFYLLSVPALRKRAPWSEMERWYRNTLEQSDRKLGQVVDALRRSGRLERTWIIVTSDHGQSFGEGGNVYHGCGATDSVTRVPLVVRPPDGISIPSRCDRWVSLCDLPSWLKAIALDRPPYDDAGYALVPFAAEPNPNEPVYSEGGPASDPNLSLSSVGLNERWNHRLFAAYVGDRKYLYDTVVGDVRMWEGKVDPDREPPRKLDAAEIAPCLLKVFGPGNIPELFRGGANDSAAKRTPLQDARMRSWGYD